VLDSPGSNPEEWFVSLLPVLNRIIAFEVRRHRASPETHEDFRSQVHLRLIENDYAILRKFEGRSSIQTFLTTVVVNQFKDYLNRELGKWRPSAVAARLGAEAVQLERYLIRDQLPFDEACAALAARHGVTASREELEALARKLPVRFRRRRESEAAIENMAAPGGADQNVLDDERAAFFNRVMGIITKACAAMAPEDAVLVSMRFADGRKVSDIAAALGLPQKPLYERLNKLARLLRSSLEAEGISAEVARNLLEGD
jgi:RNA polymerase sigma factor for flagellar operon FliA